MIVAAAPPIAVMIAAIPVSTAGSVMVIGRSFEAPMFPSRHSNGEAVWIAYGRFFLRNALARYVVRAREQRELRPPLTHQRAIPFP
jgi:hypothetical protein